MSISKRKKDKGHKSFVMLPRKMLRIKEWKELRPAAKIFYIYLKGKYNGSNNGKIRLYYSELEEIKGLSSHSTISGAIKELEEKYPEFREIKGSRGKCCGDTGIQNKTSR